MQQRGPAETASFGFPRSHRLTRGAELQAVRQEGKRIRTGHLEVRAIASLLSHPRVGLVVPKYKRSGVERNLLKRRLREIARTRLLPELRVAPPLDVVIRALPEAYDAPFDRLRDDAVRSVERVARRVVAEAPRPAEGPA